MRRGHFLLVVLAAVLWGGGGALGVLLADHSDLHPLSVATWRMLLAGGALLLLALATRSLNFRALTSQMWIRAALTGALTAAFEGMYFVGISLTSLGLTTLIAIGSAPVFVALYDWLVRHEKPQAKTLIALVLALTGLVLLLSGSLDAGTNALVGAGLAFAAGAAFAAISIINRTPVPGFEPVPLTALTFAIGGLLMLPFAMVAGFSAPRGLGGWAFALAVGILSTALAYVAYLTGLKTVPPFVATIVVLLEPLIAAILGAVLFEEVLGVSGIIGAVVLGSAVILLRPQRDEPESIH